MPEAEKNDKSESSSNQAVSGFRRRWLLNVGLLGLIAALAWVVVHRMGQEKDVPGPPLTGLSAAAVSHVRIERPEQPAIAIEKAGNEWKLTAPLPARANLLNVENLLRVLSAPV